MTHYPYIIWVGGDMKVKSLDEIVSRYAESALISAVRLRRYWISQGLSEDEAIERALKQALGMLEASGLGPEKLLNFFMNYKVLVMHLLKYLKKFQLIVKKEKVSKMSLQIHMI
jgi:hypothetical protein